MFLLRLFNDLALEFSADWGARCCRRWVGRRNLACRSGETLEEFQHQVQSDFLCTTIIFFDRKSGLFPAVTSKEGG
jgi:hypothetical protein